MLVPHGSEALRSWSVSERALRAVAWGGVVAGAVLLTGVGTIVRQLGRLGASAAQAATLGGDAGKGDVDSLRARVADLDQTLDAIREGEERLRLVSGSGVQSATSDSVALLLRAEADSLLRVAGSVAKGYGRLSDSAARSAGSAATAPSRGSAQPGDSLR